MNQCTKDHIMESLNGNLSVFNDLGSLNVNVMVIKARTATGYNSCKVETIYFCLNGKGSIIMSAKNDDRCVKIKKGTVIVIPAGWNYNIISKSDKDLEFVAVNSKGVKNGKNKR